MSDGPFKVGDIVQLKSGGPPMTVTQVNTNLVGISEVKCQWFFGMMWTSTFKPDTLIPSVPRPLEDLTGGFLSGGRAMTGQSASPLEPVDQSGPQE